MQEITVELLLSAYANGYFPMADSKEGTELRWFYPKKRGILPLDAFHTPKSLNKFIKNNMLKYSVDRAFPEVIAACSERDEDTWINNEIIELYCELNRLGFAHSVECWQPNSEEFASPEHAPCEGQQTRSGGNDKLIGGLYGVSLGGAFFGESMFSRAPNASKCALVHLVQLLKEAGYTLLDTQYVNDHLKQFGVIEIPRASYLEKLEAALHVKPTNCWL